MAEKDSSEENQPNEVQVSSEIGLSVSASLSYISAFPKRQLEYAKNNRDRAGEIEAQFENTSDKLPDDLKVEYQQNVISAVVNSLAFLEGQKYWFIYRIDEGKWSFDKPKELRETGWKGLEDAFVRMIKHANGESKILEDSKPYDEIKALREFRNNLMHFKSPLVEAGNEHEVEDYAEQALREQDFSKSPWGTENSYPFHWLSYDMAERSVRMAFTLWRFFGRELDKEDEFLTGVPSP